jgi:hypothetical protein
MENNKKMMTGEESPAIAMLSGYLLPGYLLKNRVDHDKV